MPTRYSRVVVSGKSKAFKFAFFVQIKEGKSRRSPLTCCYIGKQVNLFVGESPPPVVEKKEGEKEREKFMCS